MSALTPNLEIFVPPGGVQITRGPINHGFSRAAANVLMELPMSYDFVVKKAD